jgi:hypothetical protein
LRHLDSYRRAVVAVTAMAKRVACEHHQAQREQPPDCPLAVGVGANKLGPVRRFRFGPPSALEPQSSHGLARARQSRHPIPKPFLRIP